MKCWCRYCRLQTPAAPAHPGRPRVCAICLHPYDPENLARCLGMQSTAGPSPTTPAGSPAREPVQENHHRED